MSNAHSFMIECNLIYVVSLHGKISNSLIFLMFLLRNLLSLIIDRLSFSSSKKFFAITH